MQTKSAVNIKSAKLNGNGKANGEALTKERIDVRKTYKLYIDGKFPRSESGRYLSLKNREGELIAHSCRASRKDLRDSVVSNRKAQEAWANRSAYNKGQILYRIAETLETRKAQFAEMLIRQGFSAAAAGREVENAVDLLVYYAGWTDKYIQVFSSVNPVESSHFNFSFPEPTGIVNVLAPQDSPLEGLAGAFAPIIAGGNTCTVIASEKYPLSAIDLAEVIHASDVPGGVINILTGTVKELAAHAASHMDVNAVVLCDKNADTFKLLETQAALNLKRVIDFSSESLRSPYRILAAQEIKTTWHPVGL